MTARDARSSFERRLLKRTPATRLAGAFPETRKVGRALDGDVSAWCRGVSPLAEGLHESVKGPPRRPMRDTLRQSLIH